MATQSHPTVYETDLYRLLQVHPKAEPAVITAAHRALLKVHGPRMNGDSEAYAKQIGEAHIILSDPTERRRYDDYRKTPLKTIGPYRLINRVAEGGFGVTYKAEHTLLGSHSCIKHCSEISLEAEQILRQETNAIWNLRHYGLPIMRDLLRLDDGSYALAMSWIEGRTLQQAVEKYGKLDPEDVAWIMERILNTLMYLHDHGVVHGDIKPQNIIVQPDSHIVVLLDFGLSMVKPSPLSGSKGYTDIFSPPEQVEGKTVLPEADFYSLGMTAIYALSGSYDTAARRSVPINVPDPLCDFIKSLIVHDVRNRPKNTRDLFNGFEDIRQKSFGRTRSAMKQFSVV